MNDADVSVTNPAQALAKLRWSPSPVVQRAAQTVVDRWDELDDEHRAQLRAKAEESE
jgi:hypothetical protein